MLYDIIIIIKYGGGMIKNLFLFIACLACCDAFAASPRDGRNVVNDASFGAQNNISGQYRAGVNIKNTTTNVNFAPNIPGMDSGVGSVVPVQSAPVVDVQPAGNVSVSVPEKPVFAQPTGQQLEIQKQRDICVRNNIGVGNTFVWAAKNSDVSNYSMMIEDVNTPENNTCFVKVAINSADSRVKVSDIPTKYFEMGRAVTCGSWVDEEMLEQRILNAKKNARTWGVVGATVGGAAVGVGAMELFGNKLIGGAVEGQKALEGQDLIVSQLKALKKDNPSEYERVVSAISDLEAFCDNPAVWGGTEKPRDCDASENNFMGLLEKLK